MKQLDEYGRQTGTNLREGGSQLRSDAESGYVEILGNQATIYKKGTGLDVGVLQYIDGDWKVDSW
jgi:hypothetical protein